MRSHPSGIRPDFIREIRDVLDDVDKDELIELQSMGIRPDYVREIFDILGAVSIDELVELKASGVNPDFVRGLVDAGIADISVDEVVRRRYGDA